MEKGRSEQLIERLIDMVENGQSMPLSTGKVVVNKEEAVLMLKELSNIVHGELRMYREFNDRRGKIINDAKKEAEDIIYEAEQTASRIRVTKRMSEGNTLYRPEKLDVEERKALRTATDIYAASIIYTDEMLTEVNDVVAQAYDLISNQYGKMVDILQEKAKIIADNKAELMNSLKELSREERYSQILDLGQLLSYEIYNERIKAREADDSDNFQMEFNFEEQKNMEEVETTKEKLGMSKMTSYVSSDSIVAEPVAAEKSYEELSKQIQEEPKVTGTIESI